MNSAAASIVFGLGILGLFYCDRHDERRVSGAIWVPAIWLFLISSRPLSLWLGTSAAFNAVDATQAYVEGSPLDRNAFLVLMLTALAVLATRSGRVVEILQNNGLVVSYLLFCMVSVCWSDFPFVAFKRWNKALGETAMVLIILTESHPLSALTRLLTRLGFLIFPLSILYYKYYPQIGRRLTNSWTLECTGVATQKNELGLDCMVFGVLFFWMFLSVYRDRVDPSRRRRLLAYGTIIAMIAWLLVQCNSTTSIVGLLSATAVVWVGSIRSQKAATVHLLVFGILGLAVTALFFDSNGGMIRTLGKDPTLTGRTDIWRMVLAFRTNPWIGTGFESFWLGNRLTFMRTALPNFPINEAHNGYLELYLNLGWTGLLFIATLLATAYNRIRSRLRHGGREGSLLLGFLLCALFYSFSEAGFRIMTVSWFFLLIVTMGASQAVLGSQDAPTEIEVADGSRRKEPACEFDPVWLT